jgi:hypothetical protein
MLEIARHLIDEPGIEASELIGLLQKVPSLNDSDTGGIEDILLRVRFTNQILPQIRSLFADEMAGFKLELEICHQGLAQAEELASLLNTPYRETMAAFARAGIQVVIRFILQEDGRLEIKSQAKTHLIFFALIEMLALGTKTGAYQFCYILPQTASPELFPDSDIIRPVVQVRPGEDERKFKGSVAFGQTLVERLIVPIPGQEFYYIADEDDSSDPQSS